MIIDEFGLCENKVSQVRRDCCKCLQLIRREKQVSILSCVTSLHQECAKHKRARVECAQRRRRRRSIETKAAKTPISTSPPPQPLPPPPPPNNDDDDATPGVSLQTHTFKQAFDIFFRECARQQRQPTFIAGEPGNMATLFGWDKLIEQRLWRSILTKKLTRHFISFHLLFILMN